MLQLIHWKNFFRAVFILLLFTGLAYFALDLIQTKNNRMDIEDYEPRSTLVVPETLLTSAKFPFVDVHNHQFDMPVKDLTALVTEMDRLNMAYMVNLSGFRGFYLEQSLKNIRENAPTRFGLFLNINFETIDESDLATKNIVLIKEAVDAGVIGLKVYKSLGLTDKDSQGNRIGDR